MLQIWIYSSWSGALAAGSDMWEGAPGPANVAETWYCCGCYAGGGAGSGSAGQLPWVVEIPGRITNYFPLPSATLSSIHTLFLYCPPAAGRPRPADTAGRITAETAVGGPFAGGPSRSLVIFPLPRKSAYSQSTWKWFWRMLRNMERIPIWLGQREMVYIFFHSL